MVFGALIGLVAGKYAEFIGKDSTWETVFDERKDVEMFQDQAAASKAVTTVATSISSCHS